MELSRRNFLAGLATAGIGAAGMSLAACSPAKDQNTGDKQEATTEVEKSASGDWLGKEPEISDADVEAEEECDVVVIGLGNAGVMAYRSAAEAGANTIAIEKAESYNATGGAFALIGGMREERWHAADIDKEEIINRHMQECGYYVKRAIIRRYVYEVGDVFNWIIEPLTDLYIAETSRDDIPDGKENNLIPDSYPLPDWYDYRAETCSTFPTSVGFGSFQIAHGEQIAAAEATGNAKAYYGHFAEKLIKEGDTVTGVFVRNAETGKYKKIAAKSVILATGDYSSDKSMLEAFAPETLANDVPAMWIHRDVEGNNTNTGDGHRMGTWAGARMQQHHAP